MSAHGTNVHASTANATAQAVTAGAIDRRSLGLPYQIAAEEAAMAAAEAHWISGHRLARYVANVIRMVSVTRETIAPSLCTAVLAPSGFRMHGLRRLTRRSFE